MIARRQPSRGTPILLAVVSLAVLPNLLALLSFCGIPLPHAIGILALLWFWGLGGWVAVIVAGTAALLVPWRATARAAGAAGWLAVAAGVSTFPTNLFSWHHWRHHRMEYASIVTPEGLVRDAALSMKLATAAILVGTVIVMVRRRRSEGASLEAPKP